MTNCSFGCNNIVHSIFLFTQTFFIIFVFSRKGHQIKVNFRFLNIQKPMNPLTGTVSFWNHSPEWCKSPETQIRVKKSGFKNVRTEPKSLRGGGWDLRLSRSERFLAGGWGLGFLKLWVSWNGQMPSPKSPCSFSLLALYASYLTQFSVCKVMGFLLNSKKSFTIHSEWRRFVEGRRVWPALQPAHALSRGGDGGGSMCLIFQCGGGGTP